MNKSLEKIGVREFRNNFSRYSQGEAVAVTMHGRTVGYYLPVFTDPREDDMKALIQAGKEMENLLAEHGTSEDEIVAEFQEERQKARKG